MKILDGIVRFGKACSNITFSHSHDITDKLHSKDTEKPIFLWHSEGAFSVKILKVAVSTALVVGGYAIADSIKKAKKSK